MLPWDYLQPIVKNRTFAGWVVAHPDTLVWLQPALDAEGIRGYPDSEMEPGKIMAGYKGPKYEEGYVDG